eukprot:5543871-Pyramimonas_sp.AAC.1
MLTLNAARAALLTSNASWGFRARMADLLEILSLALRQPPTRTLAAFDTAAPTMSSAPSTRSGMSSTNCLNRATCTADWASSSTWYSKA